MRTFPADANYRDACAWVLGQSRCGHRGPFEPRPLPLCLRPPATEALVARVSGRPGGRATEPAVTYLRLARPTFGAETGARRAGADGGGHPVREVLDALSDEELRPLRDAIDASDGSRRARRLRDAPSLGRARRLAN